MKDGIWLSLLAGLLSLAVPNANTWAQSTAQISGNVTDRSGAVLPGVEVTVTQTDTGLLRSVVSNETGSYVMPNLPVGPYRLEAALPGFRTYAQAESSCRSVQIRSSTSLWTWVNFPRRSRCRRMRHWWKPGVRVSAR